MKCHRRQQSWVLRYVMNEFLEFWNSDFLTQDSFSSLFNSRQACRMNDFDNNKEKHTVCTGEIRGVSGLEWDSQGWHPRPRELLVPGTLQQRAV